jgi:hypothetical protein
MARPTARPPRTALAAAAPAEDPAAALAPAPDNGVPYADRRPSTSDAGGRRGRQLGHRIPEELYARLVACSDDTGVTQQRLIARALDAELARHGH